jgi:hypothetical protein
MMFRILLLLPITAMVFSCNPKMDENAVAYYKEVMQKK